MTASGPLLPLLPLPSLPSQPQPPFPTQRTSSCSTRTLLSSARCLLLPALQLLLPTPLGQLLPNSLAGCSRCCDHLPWLHPVSPAAALPCSQGGDCRFYLVGSAMVPPASLLSPPSLPSQPSSSPPLPTAETRHHRSRGQENELILTAVLDGLFEALQTLLRGQVG